MSRISFLTLLVALCFTGMGCFAERNGSGESGLSPYDSTRHVNNTNTYNSALTLPRARLPIEITESNKYIPFDNIENKVVSHTGRIIIYQNDSLVVTANVIKHLSNNEYWGLGYIDLVTFNFEAVSSNPDQDPAGYSKTFKIGENGSVKYSGLISLQASAVLKFKKSDLDIEYVISGPNPNYGGWIQCVSDGECLSKGAQFRDTTKYLYDINYSMIPESVEYIQILEMFDWP